MASAAGWWAPRRALWRIGVLFAIGSLCFLVAPLPGFAELVGVEADAAVFFVGSLFFTAAATLQFLESRKAGQRTTDWWSSAIQLAGTVFFNLTTFRALSTAADNTDYDRVVWRPDLFGSICFLISGYLAYVELSGGVLRRWPRTRDGRIAAVNWAGCIAFGIAAIGGYVVPESGDYIDLAAANAFTSLGALGFLIGALLLLPPAGSQP